MGAALFAMPSFAHGRVSVAFGTVINRLCEPRQNKRTKITRLVFTVAGTAHTVTVLRPLGRTTVSAAAAAGDATFTLTNDPGKYSSYGPYGALTSTANNLIAALDWVVIQKPDGTYLLDTVASATTNADGTVTIGLTTNSTLPTGGLKSGAKVWFLGVAADTDPATAKAHESVLGVVSSVNTYGDGTSVVFQSNGCDEPLLVQDSNATATGAIDEVSGFYAA